MAKNEANICRFMSFGNKTNICKDIGLHVHANDMSHNLRAIN